MPRLFSRLPVSRHVTAAKVMGVLAVLCALSALALFLAFSETTETTGHLWWKETREIPYDERRPYLLGGLAFTVAAASFLLGVLELVVARRRWLLSPEGQAHRLTEAWVEQRRQEAEAAEFAEREAERERRRWERSTAGQAAMAYGRGDTYFSIELQVDATLAQRLNEVTRAGWREHSVSRRHERKTTQRPQYDGTHEVQRESVEYRTYLFRRGD